MVEPHFRDEIAKMPIKSWFLKIRWEISGHGDKSRRRLEFKEISQTSQTPISSANSYWPFSSQV
jgi:hypothetical protein